MSGILLLIDVIEDFERDRAGVSHGQDPTEETRYVERTLSREHPVMEAPLADIHVQSRCIRELHVEHLVAGYRGEDCGIVLDREHVEAVARPAAYGAGMACSPSCAGVTV